jgi:2'-5' RNA ligase
VIWAGLTGGQEHLLAIERIVGDRLECAGVGREDRAYNPHLTLARVRDAVGLRSAALLDGVRDLPLGSARAGAITLFESRLSPKGPTYIPIQRTSLK